MCQIKLTILESRCPQHQEGQEFTVKELCPPLCHELWQCIYPQVYALSSGGKLDPEGRRADWFSIRCPGEGRVVVMGKLEN